MGKRANAPSGGEDAVRLGERLRILSRTTGAFAEATSDYRRLLDTIAESVTEFVRDACVVSVLSDDEWSLEPVSIHANDEAALGELRSTLACEPIRLDRRSFTESVFRSGVPALVPKLDFEVFVGASRPVYVEALKHRGVHSVLLVPLRARGKSIGMLSMARYRNDSPPFDEQDRDLAQILADHAALAITNSRLIGLRKNAEARFERLADAGVVGVFVCDMELRVSEINDTLLRMIGYSRDEIVSGVVPWRSLQLPDSARTDERAIHQLRTTGVAELREKEYVRKDGARVPVLVGSAVVGGGDDRIISFVLDLTVQKRVEAVASAEHARFQALVEKSADGVVLVGTDHVLRYVSPAAARMLGRSAGALVGTSFRDYVHPDDVAQALDQRRRLLAGEQNPPTERRIVRPDGSIGWLEVTSTNRIDDPAIGAVVVNLRDVTERRLAEEALGLAERRFAALFESGVMGIIVSDTSGPIRDANDTFLAMVGYTRGDLASGRLDWKTLTPPEWTAWNTETFDELRRTGRARPREKEYLRKDGTRVPVLVGVAAIDDGLALSVSVDLSDRKQAEAVQAQLESRLRQAQKMDAVGRLAGGVAHDFNNVLSVILSHCDLLLDSIDPEDSFCDEVREIRTAGERAAALTRQLLAFSRQEVIERKVIDLNDLVANMEKMFRRVLPENIDLVLLGKSLVPQIHVDPSGIEQVVMNLVVNARDAMPNGGKLTIETEDVELDQKFATEHLSIRPGPHVMLAVTDTGVGMDAATQARIFEPFFTTKEKGKGTGLGLSTVFGIVTQSGGGVWVYSEVGRGTTFKVYFACAEAPIDPVEATGFSTSLGGDETILLVEDDRQLRGVACGILARRGYAVVEARDGADARAICERHAGPIHLLVTDVVMPHMSGPELAASLVEQRPEMKVLCMSGYTDDGAVRHGVLASRFAFLQKPITPDTLARKVREVLDANKS